MYLLVILNVIIHGCLTGSRVVMALFAIELGVNAFSIGIMAALYSLTPLLLGVTAGRAADRYGVKPPMLFGAVLCGVGLMLPYLWPKVATLYVSATVIGAGFVIYNVAVQNLTGAWGPREDRAKNFSTLSLGYSISSFIGPLAVGYVIEYSDDAHRISVPEPVAHCSRSRYCSLDRKLREVRTPPAAEHTQSAFSLLLQPQLRKVLLTGAMIVTGWDLYMFYLPLYGHSIGLAPSTIGIILGMFAVATFVVRFWLPQLNARFTARRVLAVSMYFGVLVFTVFPFAGNAWLIGALSFGIGLALGCGQPITLLMAYNCFPPAAPAKLRACA